MTMLEDVAPRERYRLTIGDAAIERLRQGDVRDLWTLIERDRDHLEAFGPSVDATAEALDISVERVERAWDAGYQFRYCVRHAGSLIGICGFSDVRAGDRVGHVECWLAATSCGLGIATDAMQMLLWIAFSELDLQRVEMQIAMGNHHARRLMERLGFTLEGIRRRSARISTGELVDLAVYGLLVESWQAPTRPQQ